MTKGAVVVVFGDHHHHDVQFQHQYLYRLRPVTLEDRTVAIFREFFCFFVRVKRSLGVLGDAGYDDPELEFIRIDVVAVEHGDFSCLNEAPP